MFVHNLKTIFNETNSLKKLLQKINYGNNCNILRNIQQMVEKISSNVQNQENQEKFIIGEKYYGFKVINIEQIPEFSIKAIRLLHEKTNAEYLHLYRDDINNVFSINFRTTPLDNTGKPHILEHTVLCGSKRYPVRDPFFKMLNRSLATFMNAMTAPDYTMYPFSTTNQKDYRNLQSIYLDAVFNPNLNRSDFMQEGWRLEQQDLSNPHSDIIIKGVVFNEMKGAFAENERIIGEKLLNIILPDHTYGVISGGDPLAIPQLTWHDLKQFHRTYYHPSNCKFFSYGNFPLLPTLDYVNENYLKNYSKIDVKHTQVPSQQRWQSPKHINISGRFNEMGTDKQNSILVAYLMNDITDVYGVLVMQFVSELLLKGVNSPFYKSLIEPNFSGGYSTQTGYDGQTKDTIFVLGLQAIDENDFDKFLKIFDDTIDKVIKNGFANDQIEMVLHSYELGLKHESSNFGLRLLFNIIPIWNHNGDILKTMKVNHLLDQLKNDIKCDPKFLQKVVNARFKNNSHRLILTMKPDKDYDRILQEKERQLLNDKVSNLDDVERKQIFELARQLQNEQKTAAQNTNVLPTLIADDIVKKIPLTNASFEIFDNVPVQICEAPTNGITYLKMICDITHLKDFDHQMLLPLFNNVISKLGTNNYNYRQFDTYVKKKTSGLAFSTHISENLTNIDQFESGVSMNSYCLDNNLTDMLKIWNEIFTIEQLSDLNRFELLTNLYVTNLTHGIADSGHLYAMQSANSNISTSSYQRELLGGLSHIKYMKLLSKNMNYRQVLDKIKEMIRFIFNKQNFRIAVNCLPENRHNVLTQIEHFVKNLPGESNSQLNERIYFTGQSANSSNSSSVQCKHHILNIPVYFAAKSIKTVPYMDDKFAHLRILSRYLTAKYLYPVIREANGAYGSGARLTGTGIFGFFSYRDPNHVKTLDVFDQAHNYLEQKFQDMTEQDIFEAKLNIFQSVDAPISPGSKGDKLFYLGLTDEMFQQHREKLLSVTKQDLKNVSEQFLSELSSAKMSKVILGPEIENFHSYQKNNENWSVEKE